VWCCWRCCAASTEAPNVAVGLRDGDDDGGAGSAALLTAGGEGLDGMDKSHSRLDKTREGTRQFGLCGVVDRGVVDMSAVQNLSGVVARLPCVNGPRHSDRSCLASLPALQHVLPTTAGSRSLGT
jgi:hypothetical protein